MDTRLMHTTTYYPDAPDCRLVFSEINEIVFLIGNSAGRRIAWCLYEKRPAIGL